MKFCAEHVKFLREGDILTYKDPGFFNNKEITWTIKIDKEGKVWAPPIKTPLYDYIKYPLKYPSGGGSNDWISLVNGLSVEEWLKSMCSPPDSPNDGIKDRLTYL